MNNLLKLRRPMASTLSNFSVTVLKDNNQQLTVDNNSGRFCYQNNINDQEKLIVGSSHNFKKMFRQQSIIYQSQRGFFKRKSAKKMELYNILEVPMDASQADIKKSFYKLAKHYHPDVNNDKDAHKRYVEINE